MRVLLRQAGPASGRSRRYAGIAQDSEDVGDGDGAEQVVRGRRGRQAREAEGRARQRGERLCEGAVGGAARRQRVLGLARAGSSSGQFSSQAGMGTAPGTYHGTLEPFEDSLGPPVPFRFPPRSAARSAHDERLHALGRLGGHVPRGADGLAVAVDIEREAVRDQLVPGAAGRCDDDAAARAERGDVGSELNLDELVRRTL